MFERFTSGSRRALVLAQEVARERGDAEINTGHLLVGLARSGDAAVEGVLASVGIDGDAALDALGAPGAGQTPGAPPFTADAKKALELSLREALMAACNKIDPGFVLLGVLREGAGPGGRFLRDAGADLDDARGVVEAAVDADQAGERERRPRRARRAARRAIDVEGLRLAALPQTRGAKSVSLRLRRLALREGKVVDTVDYLLAVLDESEGRAARVLGELGVTAQAVREKAAEVPAEGTSDEVPRPKRQTPITIDLGGMEVRITDPEAIARLKSSATAAAGDDVALAEVVRAVLRQRLGEEPGEAGSSAG